MMSGNIGKNLTNHCQSHETWLWQGFVDVDNGQSFRLVDDEEAARFELDLADTGHVDLFLMWYALKIGVFAS